MNSAQRKYRIAIESIVYLANKEKRLYWLLKMIWFAERVHMSRYGMMFLGDDYIAMSHGPVPSLAYDIIKDARGDGWNSFENPEPNSVIDTPDRRTVLPLRKPDNSFLSESARECLDDAYEKLSELTFSEVKKCSHTAAHKAADQDDTISFEEFVKDLDNGQEVLSYLSTI
ncbi:MAG: DUF4065 domain-containing protein [Chloroflexi bacterium]|nr:DUF4065 domain-containing protein [Chloroflexota bacterium]